ncbi:hypothetical protein K3495_g6490 [Podosphaera aphanis]|nr:hypothetical protein K3495_g6490 [Podosphaera aphanis]
MLSLQYTLRFWNRTPLSIIHKQRRRYSDQNLLKEFKKVYNISGNPRFHFGSFITNEELVSGYVNAVGFLKKIDSLSKNLVFGRMTGPNEWGNSIQLIARTKELCDLLRDTKINSPISINGHFKLKHLSKKEIEDCSQEIEKCQISTIPINKLEVELHELICLNSFPRNFHTLKDQVFLPESRYLQIRFDQQLRERLVFRSDLVKAIREILHDFHEIETPILFKSTPEGANEFIVPSRKYGHAYALPQSPQQYKQILMASGIEKYLQFAKCFRDEDLRADRQPEFTQVDLEVAFASGEQIMNIAESLIKQIYRKYAGRVPDLNVRNDSEHVAAFPIISYNEAMSRFGSDKPDLRINGLITVINDATSKALCSMLTPIADPIIETSKLRLRATANKVQEFVRNFMESPDSEPFKLNPDGAPGFAIYDPTNPIEGLNIFGFEGAANLRDIYERQTKPDYLNADTYAKEKYFSTGDLFLIQARPNLPHSGSSTMLGKLRTAIYKAALKEELIEPDPKHHYLWVTGFPLFTLNNDDNLGQGGSSGFSATHHPFTAPKTAQDVDLMLSDPLKAIADHYDLVVNGIELGGGSRRIHVAEMQNFVMKDVLKMSDERINQFSHLLDALSAGCPPHAGMALGFDRLVAILTGQESIKNVIAFPKSSKGDDLLVKSPALISHAELERYHFILADNQRADRTED